MTATETPEERRRLVVHRGTLHTGARCIQGHVVYRGTLLTGVLCINGHVVYRGTLYTGARC